MKALLVFVTCLTLASFGYAGCASCQTALVACTNYTTTVNTCECSRAFRTCMNQNSCCSTANTSDACDLSCNANCYDSNCTWPGPLEDNCPNRGICEGYRSSCTGSACKCEVELRQCLLAQLCSYPSASSTTCTSSCSSRTPSPDCSAKAASAPTPTPTSCVRAGYISSGDCTCADDIRNVAPNAVCATGTWTVTGNFVVSGSSGDLVLEADTVVVSGSFTVNSGSRIIFLIDPLASKQPKVTVSGTATLNGGLQTTITRGDTTQHTFELITGSSFTVSGTGTLSLVQFPTGYCAVTRTYPQTATSISVDFQGRADSSCVATPTPLVSTPPGPPSAFRPSPPVRPPTTSASILEVSWSFMLVITALWKFLGANAEMRH